MGASEPASPTCNRYETQMHALMFRTQPLDQLHEVQRSGQKLTEWPQHTAVESSSVPSESGTTAEPNSAKKLVRRNKDKIFKFQTRQQNQELSDEDAIASDQSDDEDAATLVSAVSSDAATTVPGVAVERTDSKESGDPIDGVLVQISEENIETLLQRVPRNAKGEQLSIGSVGHEDGTCKPCVFAYSERKTCENGVRCLFCHFEHVQKKRQRLSKKNRVAAAQSKDSLRSKGS